MHPQKKSGNKKSEEQDLLDWEGQGCEKKHLRLFSRHLRNSERNVSASVSLLPRGKEMTVFIAFTWKPTGFVLQVTEVIFMSTRKMVLHFQASQLPTLGLSAGVLSWTPSWGALTSNHPIKSLPCKGILFSHWKVGGGGILCHLQHPGWTWRTLYQVN